MNKTILLILAFCFSITLTHAQSLMTVREIYDYGIGDVFQRGSYPSAMPPTITTTTITGKSYSSLADTVFYTYYETAFTAQACQTCPAIYDTVQGSLMYTYLGDTVGVGPWMGVRPHYWYWDCIDTAGYTGIWVDSVFFDPTFCNRQITEIQEMRNGPQLIDSCYSYFEPEFGKYQYGNGIGVRSYIYNNCGQGAFPGCLQQQELNFYIKGNDSCGLRYIVPLPLATDQPRVADVFRIVPNPATAQTQFIFSEPQIDARITITNLMGANVKRITFSGNALTVDVTALAAGTYFVQANDGSRSYSTKMMVR